MRYLITITSILIALSLLTADEIEDNPLSGGYIPVGLRGSAMGGAQIALAQDFSASYYNPAGLAYIYKHEVTGGISVFSGQSETSVGGSSPSSKSFSAVKLSHIGYVLPLLAKRGGAAFAVGFSRFQTFDHSANFSGKCSDGTEFDAIEASDGGMGALHIAAAVQTSKKVSVGASLDFLSGAENYNWDMTKYNIEDSTITDSIISDKITNAHSGYTAKIGLLITPSKYFSIGTTIKFPSYISTDREYIQETIVDYTDSTYSSESPYVEEYDISLTTPFQFGGGLAFKSPAINIAADVIYTDWRQMRYHSSYLIEDNVWIPENYRAVLTLSTGMEFTLPFDFLPIKIRGGYRYDPLPYKNQTVLKERQFYTGGIAFLIDKKWLFEGSVVMDNWQKSRDSSCGKISEEYKITDIMIGLSYRF